MNSLAGKSRRKNVRFASIKLSATHFSHLSILIIRSVREQKRKWEEEKEMAKIQKKLDAETKKQKSEEEAIKQRATEGRDWTVSIALPGSIVDNAQSDELKTYLAGQVS